MGLLYKWIRQYKGIDSQGKANGSQEEIKEIQVLKKQLATSEQYREILKSKTINNNTFNSSDNKSRRRKRRGILNFITNAHYSNCIRS